MRRRHVHAHSEVGYEVHRTCELETYAKLTMPLVGYTAAPKKPLVTPPERYGNTP